MSTAERTFILTVEKTEGHCPIGEIVGQENIATKKIPVFSCEGACIRGETARKAANLVAKKDLYRRGCHGELLTVPQSAIAKWALSHVGQNIERDRRSPYQLFGDTAS